MSKENKGSKENCNRRKENRRRPLRHVSSVRCPPRKPKLAYIISIPVRIHNHWCRHLEKEGEAGNANGQDGRHQSADSEAGSSAGE